MGLAIFITLLLVVACIILVGYFLQARYDVRLENWLSVHKWSFEYPCCNHCFTEYGKLSHARDMIDRHTVECNEPFCSQGK